jgi:transposase
MIHDPLSHLIKNDYAMLAKRYRELKASGVSDEVIAMRLGVSRRTLYNVIPKWERQNVRQIPE